MWMSDASLIWFLSRTPEAGDGMMGACRISMRKPEGIRRGGGS